MKPILALSMATLAIAETTVVQTFRAGPTDLPLNMVASVIDANADATTYALQCPLSASEPFCPLATPITLAEGPSTASVSIFSSTSSHGMHATITMLQDCALTSVPPAVSAWCEFSYRVGMSAHGMTTSTSDSSQTTLASGEISYAPLTVTAGVEKLRAPRATQSPGAAAAAGGIGAGSGTTIGGAAVAAVVAAIGMI